MEKRNIEVEITMTYEVFKGTYKQMWELIGEAKTTHEAKKLIKENSDEKEDDVFKITDGETETFYNGYGLLIDWPKEAADEDDFDG